MKKDTFTDSFSDSLKFSLEAMTGLKTEEKFEFSETISDFDAKTGIVSIVGFSGKMKGRCLLWLPSNLAQRITYLIVGEEPESYKDETVYFTINELNNVISGRAITELNNLLNLSLRLSPPSVFAGESFTLNTPKLKTYQTDINIEGNGMCFNFAVEGSLEDE